MLVQNHSQRLYVDGCAAAGLLHMVRRHTTPSPTMPRPDRRGHQVSLMRSPSGTAPISLCGASCVIGQSHHRRRPARRKRGLPRGRPRDARGALLSPEAPATNRRRRMARPDALQRPAAAPAGQLQQQLLGQAAGGVCALREIGCGFAFGGTVQCCRPSPAGRR